MPSASFSPSVSEREPLAVAAAPGGSVSAVTETFPTACPRVISPSAARCTSSSHVRTGSGGASVLASTEGSTRISQT